MSILIGIGMLIYGAWRAFINYQLFAAAAKEYGPEWMRPREIPNYGLRFWFWTAVAVLGEVMCGFFEGGSGCGSRGNPCL